MRSNSRLEEISRQLDMIYTALVVRDPGTSMSVDAYEGLRKQVVAAATERRAHVVHLTQIDAALSTTSDLEALKALSAEWLGAAGILKLTEASEETAAAFEVLGDGDGPLVVDSPAYVDSATGQPARRGRAHRAAPEQPTTDDAEMKD